ncbi:ceramide synthase 1-like isoform X2 [Varroa jacobsoni]|uniref:TLC domain-containing protein n=1 Tax=Varroa destructor TaxID=109461 RepID=A0A7M7JSR6_VARDE|nr:ceramide synthase 1-like isoform X2 [Varroa destructor]XP_022696167.1 ceramide synthase 1-like isoform X2 [Varroa jacobsoni]
MNIFSMDEWESTPSLLELIQSTYKICHFAWYRKPEGRETLLASLNTDLNSMSQVTYNEVILLVATAVAFTIFRKILTKCLLTPMAKWLKLDENNVVKFPESGWKFMIHGGLWLYTFYILMLSGRHQFFHRPSTVWDGWSMDMEIQRDIYVIYVLEGAYYLHGLYALFFYDLRRKDRQVMVAHHVICVFLLWLSYVQRCHNVGILVVFLHDVSDILLELVKIFVLLRSRQGIYYRVWGILALIFFALLIISWALTRLYYYPFKAIYATSGILLDTSNMAVLGSCSVFMILMLYVIFIMDLYWFGDVALTAHQVSGRTKLHRTRETIHYSCVIWQN